MKNHVCGLVAVLVVLFVLLPGSAAGSLEPGWPLAGPAPMVLGFGERYAAPDGSFVVHRGIDLAAAPGSAVGGVLPGMVTFAGRVPAGEGATTLAVTVESGDVRLTYSPLSEISVSAGEGVDAGSRLGSLAETGDRSCPEPHLHLSARRGTLYVDPSPFLLAPIAGSVGEAEAATAPSPAPSASAVTAPSPVPVAPVSAAAPAVATQPAPVPGALVSSLARVGQATPAASGSSAPAPAVTTPEPAPGVRAAPLDGRVLSVAGDTPTASRLDAALPEPARAALTVDRREMIAAGDALPVGGIGAAAAALAVALLWPLWRAAPSLSVPVIPEREDVAAVVAR
jgi:hypothetical protein